MDCMKQELRDCKTFVDQIQRKGGKGGGKKKRDETSHRLFS
jgi:hypothetical protein